MSQIAGHSCLHYEVHGRTKPNPECANCPLPIKENCTENGVVLHSGSYLHYIRGKYEITKARRAFQNIITRYGAEVVTWMGVEKGIWLDTAVENLKSKETRDKILVALGQLRSRKKKVVSDEGRTSDISH